MAQTNTWKKKSHTLLSYIVQYFLYNIKIGNLTLIYLQILRNNLGVHY